MSIDDAPRVEVRSRAEWRRWLEQNHDTAQGVWLVTWKKHHPERYLPWGHIVKEALCFGWVDSRTRRVDDDRTSVYVTHRKGGSAWSALNKGYVEELEAEKDASKREALFNQLVESLYDKGKAVESAASLEIDGVFDPADSRRHILRALA